MEGEFALFLAHEDADDFAAFEAVMMAAVVS